MSVYKSLTTSDVVVTPFKVNKSFSFEGSGSFNLPNVNIKRYLGTNITSSYISGSNPTGGEGKTLNQQLVYNSVKQLYYSNYLRGEDGSPVLTSSIDLQGVTTSQTGVQPMYDNYLPNTLDANRVFPTASGDEIGIFSIPTNLFGENIKPGSFKIEYQTNTDSGTFIDDGEGNILDSQGKVGDIIYQHGMVVFTALRNSISGGVYGSAIYGTSTYGGNTLINVNELINLNNITCSFQSTMTIYESQYKCTFNPSEFVFSQNPSIISGSCNNLDGKLYDFATGSYFEPYITTVGLYNRANQLIAIGKLAQPLQSSNVTDTTILVNLDL